MLKPIKKGARSEDPATPYSSRNLTLGLEADRDRTLGTQNAHTNALTGDHQSGLVRNVPIS